MKKFITKMKRTLFILTMILLGTAGLRAQSGLTVEGSQYISSYKFIESNEEKFKGYIPVLGGGYALGYIIDNGSGLLVHPRVGMRPGGATLMHENSNYIWETQSLDFRVGIGYGFEMGRFTPYAKLSPYFGIVLKGNQVLNNQNYDLIKTGSMKSTDFGFYFSPGIKTALNDLMSAYLELSYYQGLTNIETDTNGQKSLNIGASATFGIIFNIAQLSGGGSSDE